MKLKMKGFKCGRLDCTLRYRVCQSRKGAFWPAVGGVLSFSQVSSVLLCFPLTSLGLKVRGNNLSHIFKNQIERGLNLLIFLPWFDLEFKVP